jgi:hypothetical protein
MDRERLSDQERKAFGPPSDHPESAGFYKTHDSIQERKERKKNQQGIRDVGSRICKNPLDVFCRVKVHMIDKLIRQTRDVTVHERKDSKTCQQKKGSFAGFEEGNCLE